MTDRIDLRGIEVLARHGVLEQEKTEPQVFLVDVAMFLDLRTAGGSDDLTDTVDYGRMAHEIHDVVSSETHQLIESVAERVAQRVLQAAHVERVVVTIHKAGAPIPLAFEDVSVTIDRTR